MTKNLDIIGDSSVAPRGATNIVMILDRSGSMQGKESDVIGGFNSFVASCRAANLPDCTVTYVRFDTEVEEVFREGLTNVPDMTSALYAARGGTALLDAVGQSVSPIRNEVDHRYIVITFTDGEENSSREWTKEKVAQLIGEREALGNWTFAFFGADIDAWSEAGEMGYSAGNTRSHSRQSTRDMMRASGRVASVMSNSPISSSRRYAEAVAKAAERPDVSDQEIERVLAEDADAAPPPA